MTANVMIIMFMKQWSNRFGNYKWPRINILLLFVFWIFLDLIGRSESSRHVLWLSEGQFNFNTIFTFYIPVAVLALGIVITLVDFLSFCFKRLDNFTDEKDWHISERMEAVIHKPPKTEQQAAKAEMELHRELSYEIKYLIIKLSVRFVIVVTLFILSFAEIYAFINRISISPSAFEDIAWRSWLPWHIFYSLDVITTLGGAAPTPEVKSALIWWATGFQLFFSIVITILFLTLAITSIFETFNLKTSYIPSFVKYNLEKAKDAAK